MTRNFRAPRSALRVWLAFAAFAFFAGHSTAQPALPTPMHRQVLWVQPNPTNVNGYVLRWGTNRVDLTGVSSTSAVVRLDPGLQTLTVRAAGTNGTNVIMSEAVSNTVRLLRLTLEGSTNSTLWTPETNWTWSISPADPQKVFRTRMDWSSGSRPPAAGPDFQAAAAAVSEIPAALAPAPAAASAPTSHTQARLKARRRSTP